MEVRKLKVNYNKSGSGSYTPKINLPIVDLRDMGNTIEDRQIHYHYIKEHKIMLLSKDDLSNYEIKLIKKEK